MAFASDTFTGSTPGQELSAYNSAWSKQSASDFPDDAFIGVDAQTYASATNTSCYQHSGSPAGANYSVFADLTIDGPSLIGAGVSTLMGVIGRAVGASQFYVAWYVLSSAEWRISKMSSGGSSTTLGTASLTW